MQCRAVVLNINLGYNSDIMKKCRKLKEYAGFIACVGRYLADGMRIREAIDYAVDECIEEGILEEILRNNREEVCAMLLAEYDEQAHIESEREIALKEGEERMAKLIQLLMAAGRTEDVNRAIVDREYREQLYAEESL